MAVYVAEAAAVSLSVWFAVSVCSAPAYAEGPGIPQSSVGPRSDEEAALLWKEGNAAATIGDCKSAIVPLRRFVDRYPGHENYLHAHFLLGRCEYKSGETADAIRVLRFYAGGADARLSPDYHAAKVLLARALLKIGDAAEALLVATELEKESAQSAPPDPAEALLLKTEALAARHEDVRARRALDSARNLLTPNPSDTPVTQVLRTEAAWLALKLNTHECAHYPSHEKMDEAQARNQLDRRGDCEISGLLLFHDVALLGKEPWVDRAANDLLSSFSDYAKSCENPPDPPRGKKPRTAMQQNRYRAELRTMLIDACLHRYQEARNLLTRWHGDTDFAPWRSLIDRLQGGIQGQAQSLAKTTSGSS